MIGIIGAGIIGSYLANKLSEHFDVILFEENNYVGAYHCPTIVSKKIENLLDKKIIKNTLQNTIDGAYFILENDSVLIERRKVAYVLNRPKIEQLLIERFEGELKLGEKVLSYKNKEKKVEVITNKNKYVFDILINASGKEKPFFVGINAIAEGDYSKFVKIFLDYKYSKDFFAWEIPTKNFLKVGLADKKIRGWDLFVKEKNYKIKKIWGGIIPYGKRKLREDKIFWVGSSAKQIKKTTGGGIIFGLIAANLLIKAIKFGDLDYYEEKWKKYEKILKIHDILYPSIKILKKTLLPLKILKPILEKKGDMDFIFS